MVPVLGRSTDPVFNVFDVMHHGLHEKQISNVFRWLLDKDGTHALGDRFIRIFAEAVNRSTDQPFDPEDGYWVRQEVNMSSTDDPDDIADIVLEGRHGVFAVENYFTSDGHGHDYGRYLAFSQAGGKRGRVVLLCREINRHLLTQGWEHAAVVTYGDLIERLVGEVSGDHNYQRTNPAAYSFIEQAQRKFAQGAGMPDENNVLDFVVAMCATGEAGRYQIRPVDAATEQFASDLAEQARVRFGEGRDLLQRTKASLRRFGADVLMRQLNVTLGEDFVHGVNAGYSGIYQWTINFETPSLEGAGMDGPLQVKFGPSAWHANERDTTWRTVADRSTVDYGHLFVARSGIHEIRQSDVTVEEALSGLAPDDTRLHDELVSLVRA